MRKSSPSSPTKTTSLWAASPRSSTTPTTADSASGAASLVFSNRSMTRQLPTPCSPQRGTGLAKNMDTIRGPANPSLNYEVGLLVDGFDSPPFFMMTYNKPYYGRLIEHCGLQKSQDLYAFWGHVDMLDTLDKKIGFIIEQSAERFNVQIRNLDPNRFTEDVETFLDIYNRSLVATWGFVPLSTSELKHIATGLKRLIIPELAVFAEVDGKTVGAAFCLPDYNSRIKDIDGRLFPFGFIKLLRNKRRIKRFRGSRPM